MGNRAVITTAPFKKSNVGIYLHWNGGQESIEAFLTAAKELDIRAPAADESYALARLTQLIGNFFGGTLSLGIGLCDQLDCDNGDNGTWLIGGAWELKGNKHGFKPRELDADECAKRDAILAECLEKNASMRES